MTQVLYGVALPTLHYYRLVILAHSLLLFTATPAGADQIEAQLFEAGIISTGYVEYGSSLSADGKELYFTRSLDKWGQGKLATSIFISRKKNGRWTMPVTAPFSGNHDDSDPHLVNNGNTLYFISSRPSQARTISPDIWMVRRQGGGDWGTAERLPEPVNSSAREFGPRTTLRGDLYFASDRKGSYGQGDIYVAEKLENGYLPPRNLGVVVNSPLGEWNLEISSDGGILLFEASQRKQNRSPYGDLYISFRDGNSWTAPLNIREINTPGSDLYPQLVDGNRTLYYASSQALENTSVNIYKMPFEMLLHKYRQRAFNR